MVSVGSANPEPRSDATASAAPPPAPCVSIGLPVYNGERYLAEAIESLLAQTFSDFELILCDNASVDATEAICRHYASADPRVRYVRNEQNVGALPNFNRAFELARGRYFKWAAHDDRCAPDYLAACVAVLEREPGVVLCHARTRAIDADGSPLVASDDPAPEDEQAAALRDELYDPPRRLDSADPAVRLADVLVPTRWCFEMFGVARADLVRQTPLLLSFYGSDKVFLAALALRGRFHEVPRELFFRRYHPGQSSARSYREQAAWSDARRGRRRAPVVPPQVRCLLWYLRTVAAGAPALSAVQRLRCLAAVGRWGMHLCGTVVRQRKERGFLHRLVYRPLHRLGAGLGGGLGFARRRDPRTGPSST
jgi:glycosyltransferase involved in cell wall biosynthesis